MRRPLTFGFLLRNHRRAAGLTQEALADRAALSVRGLQHLEAGDAHPSRATLNALLEALELTAEDQRLLQSTASETEGSLAKQRLKRDPAFGSKYSDRARLLPPNFPTLLTSFVERDGELSALRQLLSANRLVTLTGAGGCGKTRLALRVVADVADEYTDGVWLVELAAMTDPALVPRALADSGGVREETGRPLVSTCVDVLRPKRLLLVLDNCEHLLDACAELIETLLRACPLLTVLATSRQRLGLAGERALRVPSLSVPDSALATDIATVMRYEAVQLFVERATAIQPGFVVSNHNAAAVVEICRRLDGIPLALELAAARLRALGVGQLLDRLDDRFGILSGGSRTSTQRQQTLRATLDWSYALLGDEEQKLLARLAVFAGGWALEAAEAVCAGRGIPASEILDLLTLLVDRSLVIAETSPDEPSWYRLLETLRQYANERLSEASEESAFREAHAVYYLAMAERAEAELTGPDQVVWLDRLEADKDNLRAALRWFIEQGQAESAIRLAVALLWWWLARGHRSEGLESLVRLLALRAPVAPLWRMKALYAAGTLAWIETHPEQARDWYEHSLAMARQLGDRLHIALALDGLGRVSIDLGDTDRAAEHDEPSLAIQQEIGDHHGMAYSLFFLGSAALMNRDYVAAAARYSASLAEFRGVGDRFGQANALRALGDAARRQVPLVEARGLEEQSVRLARELGNREGVTLALDILGAIAVDEGDLAAARTYFAESLVYRRDLGARARLADSLERFATLAEANGQSQCALRLGGAAAALRTASGVTARPVWEREPDVTLGPSRDTAEAESAWVAGAGMSQEAAVAYALSLGEVEPSD